MRMPRDWFHASLAFLCLMLAVYLPDADRVVARVRELKCNGLHLEGLCI